MDSRDQGPLQDLLRLLDGAAAGLQHGARLRWAAPTALALLLARRVSGAGRLEGLWVDAPSEAEAQALAADLSALLPGAGVAYFPGFAPYAGGAASRSS
jgi:hypothetical protein